ncbi:MAG: fluoride efflux transporter FluC [Acidimicrobiia bacterium]
MTLLITTAAGSLGALCRYLLSGAVQGRTTSLLPVGTAAVNLIGAFSLGLVAGASDLSASGPVALVGFLGGFTTFSTWMVETVRLGVAPRPRFRAIANLALILVFGVMLAAIGFSMTN